MPRSGSVWILVVLLGSIRPGWAQTSMESGARAAALGGAATALTHEATGYANPASWASFSGHAVSFFATEAFGLPALRLGAAAFVAPTRLGILAGGARTFGFEAYREIHIHAGYARGFRIGTPRRLLLGLNLRYHRISISEYGSAGTQALSLGGLVEVRPGIHVGFQAANVLGPKLAGREELARTLALGMAYRPNAQVLVVLDAYKDVRFPLSVRAGVEVQPVEVLALRAGAATAPARFTAGLGLRLGLIAADVAGEHHHVLGWSPAVALGLRW